MGELSTYSSLEEKEKNFSCQRIDTKKQFDEFYNKLSKNNSIWRGLSEAKYKHYSSLQRFWINEDLATVGEDIFDYLLHISKYALSWNNSLLKKFYSYSDDRYVHLLLPTWSILRHHNAPTPLLDWSKNPKIALFFSCYFKDVKNNQREDAIENYCSLYEISDGYGMTRNYTSDLIQPLLEDFKKLDSTKTNLRTNSTFNINEYVIVYLQTMVKKGLPVIFKVDDEPNQISTEIKNSYNIISQEGLFLFNLDPITPLEEMPQKQMEFLSINGKLTSKAPKKDLIDKLETEKQKFKCYEIHKGLRSYALDKLSSDHPSIRKSTVFPDLYEMAKESYQTFLGK